MMEAPIFANRVKTLSGMTSEPELPTGRPIGPGLPKRTTMIRNNNTSCLLKLETVMISCVRALTCGAIGRLGTPIEPRGGSADGRDAVAAEGGWREYIFGWSDTLGVARPWNSFDTPPKREQEQSPCCGLSDTGRRWRMWHRHVAG